MKHVKSNAITVAKGGKLLGMGSGQPNRVKSVQIALEKAGEEVKVSEAAVSCCGECRFDGAPARIPGSPPAHHLPRPAASACPRFLSHLHILPHFVFSACAGLSAGV